MCQAVILYIPVLFVLVWFLVWEAVQNSHCSLFSLALSQFSFPLWLPSESTLLFKNKCKEKTQNWVKEIVCGSSNQDIPYPHQNNSKFTIPSST